MQKYRVHLIVPMRFAVDVEAETPFDAIEEAEYRLDNEPLSRSVGLLDDGDSTEYEKNDPVTEAIVDPFVDGERDIDASTDYRWDGETSRWKVMTYP